MVINFNKEETIRNQHSSWQRWLILGVRSTQYR